MIRAIVKLQECSTIPGRFGFVRKKDSTHGFIRGTVQLFEVQAANWAKIRREIKDYRRGVMGFTAVYPDTVESWSEFEPVEPADCFPRVRRISEVLARFNHVEVELRNFKNEPIPD